MRYSEPRFTKDLDVWVGSSPDNSRRVYHALAQFGAPLRHDGVDADTFSAEHVVYQIGVPPVRADILSSISGCVFPEAWARRVAGSMYGVPVQFISLPDLIVNKRAAGRAGDLEHLGLLGGE
jgi:hypothetical protein